MRTLFVHIIVNVELCFTTSFNYRFRSSSIPSSYNSFMCRKKIADAVCVVVLRIERIKKYSKLQFLEKTAATAVGGVATIKQLIRAFYFQLIFSLLASAKEYCRN